MAGFVRDLRTDKIVPRVRHLYIDTFVHRQHCTETVRKLRSCLWQYKITLAFHNIHNVEVLIIETAKLQRFKAREGYTINNRIAYVNSMKPKHYLFFFNQSDHSARLQNKTNALDR